MKCPEPKSWASPSHRLVAYLDMICFSFVSYSLFLSHFLYRVSKLYSSNSNRPPFEIQTVHIYTPRVNSTCVSISISTMSLPNDTDRTATQLQPQHSPHTTIDNSQGVSNPYFMNRRKNKSEVQQDSMDAERQLVMRNRNVVSRKNTRYRAAAVSTTCSVQRCRVQSHRLE